MIRKLTLSAVAALAVMSGAAVASGEGGAHIPNIKFSFDGPFGTYDQHQLQRGLQVYTEVCSACHGLQYVPYRALEALGYTEAEVRAYAAQHQVVDAETGEDRDALPTDHFQHSPLAGAPDLSLVAKSRAGFHGPYGLGLNQLFKGIGGPEYITALLTGYTGKEETVAGTTLYENHVFPSGYIAMPPPLSDDQVTYADGHPADVHHMAEDVAAFLMWAAEPEMMARKYTGLVAVFFLTILSVLLYLTNKRIWAPHKRKAKA